MILASRSIRAGSAGFSLPEVTVALGILGSVLISMAGLFVMAERIVRGGGHHTKALAIARDILEETNGWHFDGLYRTFEFDGSASSYTVDSRTHAYASGWQAMLDEDLGSAHAEITLESLDEGGSTPALRDARCIRISVTVHWRNEQRSRDVSVATVRM
jgi:prepilin-type N-terminal cleavage/methylation domain-containing protein